MVLVVNSLLESWLYVRNVIAACYWLNWHGRRLQAFGRDGSNLTIQSIQQAAGSSRTLGVPFVRCLPNMEQDSSLKSLAMLKAVIGGKTYDVVAAEHGITRTAVERRIKAFALKLSREVGIDGLNEDGLAFVQRLRNCHAAIYAALERYTPPIAHEKRVGRILTDNDISLLVQRTRARSASPQRDVALLYVLLSTGARPLEIARLEVRDYLNQDGSVRAESILREDVAVNRKARPLFFVSVKTNEAVDCYLAERLCQNGSMENPSGFRGLTPHSRLFLTDAREPFEIVNYGEAGQQRFLCRGILDAYRKIFRRTGIDGVSALNARRTVAARLFERGASEDQIGEVLGINEMKAVRELLPKERQSLQAVMRELV